jgi:hypothetical protein
MLIIDLRDQLIAMKLLENIRNSLFNLELINTNNSTIYVFIITQSLFRKNCTYLKIFPRPRQLNGNIWVLDINNRYDVTDYTI